MTYKTGDIVWARMPFSRETMRTIDENHRTRPYLVICGDEKKGYYAFPMTSGTHEREFENNIVELSSPKNKKGRSSTIKLASCYLLPDMNIIESHSKLPTDKKNEVFKKLKRNMKFHEYPYEVMQVIMETQTSFSTFDVVEHLGNLYMISSVNEYTGKAICTRVHRHPKNATYKVAIDGQYFFIDFSDVKQINILELSFFNSFKTVSQDSILYNSEIVMEDKDLTKLDNLVMGTIISCDIKGKKQRMILLEKNNGFITAIVGQDTLRFKDFHTTMISAKSNFSFTIESTLSKERLEMYKQEFIPGENPQIKTLK